MLDQLTWDSVCVAPLHYSCSRVPTGMHEILNSIYYHNSLFSQWQDVKILQELLRCSCYVFMHNIIVLVSNWTRRPSKLMRGIFTSVTCTYHGKFHTASVSREEVNTAAVHTESRGLTVCLSHIYVYPLPTTHTLLGAHMHALLMIHIPSVF